MPLRSSIPIQKVEGRVTPGSEPWLLLTPCPAKQARLLNKAPYSVPRVREPNSKIRCPILGSLHYTPEHCLVNGGVPLYLVEKAMFQIGKMYLLRSPAIAVKEILLRHIPGEPPRRSPPPQPAAPRGAGPRRRNGERRRRFVLERAPKRANKALGSRGMAVFWGMQIFMLSSRQIHSFHLLGVSMTARKRGHQPLVWPVTPFFKESEGDSR